MTLHAAGASDGVLDLEPLHVNHAAEMAQVLAEPSLYRFTGGDPPSLGTLRQRYVRQSRGVSPDGSQVWMNWIIREAQSSRAVGYVQATIPLDAAPVAASLAWLIHPEHQGRRFAMRATSLVIHQLRGHGVTEFRASIADGHVASERVAARLGMRRTAELDDGEVVWRL
ncbi:GNAT family N-acetyltransferase [Demequina sp. NBRC 110051]|uniref:GNAT family N-acetyltransferase n=1 Tax=Demequina sp. NBRC 110051 TaxID=1570340 RepID=UPI00117D43C9|nr:GNAT family N-acetyltransferase [Demequina sp. NBRC 110051]